MKEMTEGRSSGTTRTSREEAVVTWARNMVAKYLQRREGRGGREEGINVLLESGHDERAVRNSPTSKPSGGI